MAKSYISVYPGQGTVEPGMGAYWCLHSSAFKKIFEELLDYFNKKNNVSLSDIITHHPDTLIETQWAQPAIYCYQVAASSMLADYGNPAAVTGHSMGEFSALVRAGALDMYTGLDVITQRGLLMQQTAKGKVIAVISSFEQITKILHQHPEWACWIAAENDAKVYIVAGLPEDIDACSQTLASHAIRSITIPGQTAFHTPIMDQIMPEWIKICQKVTLDELTIPFYSSVIGQELQKLPDDYLITHLNARVRFQSALNNLYQDYPEHIGIEIGPNNRFFTYLMKRWEKALSLGPEKSARDCESRLEHYMSSANE